MAILKQVVNVNNGNTGWTRKNVISALEQVFANLGWHGGTSKTGVLQSVVPPTYDGTNPGWGGQLPAITSPAQNNKAWSVTVDVNGTYVFNQTAGSGSQSGTTPSLVCNQGDVLTFNLNCPGSPFYIMYENVDGYSTTYTVESGNLDNAPTLHPRDPKYRKNSQVVRNFPSAQGVETGTVTWNTANVVQGEYYYVSSSNPSVVGTITVNPRPAGATDGSFYLTDKAENVYNGWYSQFPHRCFYDVTVPESGTRSAATFRVYRNEAGRISGIEILDAESTSGWNESEVFTIPGNQVGGTTPTNDVAFGTLSGTNPSIRVTSLGSGSTFYQKGVVSNDLDSWGVLKVVNDPAKKFGTTYYTFATPNFTDLYINSGPVWIFENTRRAYTLSTVGPGDGTSSTFNTPGFFSGIAGVDYDRENRNIRSTGSRFLIKYCRTTDPTLYPLSIRVYRAQSPQDTNFAIIQFTQTVNSVVETYGTFFLHKGTLYGSGIWDLEHVYQGGITVIGPGNENESVSMFTTGQFTSVNDSSAESKSSLYSKTRECLYGYERDRYRTPQSSRMSSVYVNSIYTDTSEAYLLNVGQTTPSPYYRDSRLDSKSLSSLPGWGNLSSDRNYYRVIKGIPLSVSSVPQPYYLPDDFTLVQFAITPGASQFRTGTTIEVSPTERYEVIRASWTNDRTIPDIGGVAAGIAFCARIV